MEKKVCVLSDIEKGQLKAVSVGPWDLVVFHHEDGSVSALEDRCSHANVPLSEGEFCEGKIQCIAHGARFDARTGKNLCMPAVTPVRSFPIRVNGQDVLVDLPEA